jgi:choline dehydrogenase
VIVTAGAVGTPRFSSSPGIGPADELGALGIESVSTTFRAYGRNFHDHVDDYVSSELSGPHSTTGTTRPQPHALGRPRVHGSFAAATVTSNLAEGGAFVLTDPLRALARHPAHFHSPRAGSKRACPPSPRAMAAR